VSDIKRQKRLKKKKRKKCKKKGQALKWSEVKKMMRGSVFLPF